MHFNSLNGTSSTRHDVHFDVLIKYKSMASDWHGQKGDQEISSFLCPSFTHMVCPEQILQNMMRLELDLIAEYDTFPEQDTFQPHSTPLFLTRMTNYLLQANLPCDAGQCLVLQLPKSNTVEFALRTPAVKDAICATVIDSKKLAGKLHRVEVDAYAVNWNF